MSQARRSAGICCASRWWTRRLGFGRAVTDVAGARLLYQGPGAPTAPCWGVVPPCVCDDPLGARRHLMGGWVMRQGCPILPWLDWLGLKSTSFCSSAGERRGSQGGAILQSRDGEMSMVQAGDTHRGPVWSFVSLCLSARISSKRQETTLLMSHCLKSLCLVFVGLARGRGASPVEMLATPFYP